MEKIVYLSRTLPSTASIEALMSDGPLANATLSCSFVRAPRLLLVSAWFASLERRAPFEGLLAEHGFVHDAYLVTESRIKRASRPAGEGTEWLVLLRQASTLGQTELRHRTERLLVPAFSRSSLAAACDGVVRPLNLHAPPLRQIWTLQRATDEADHDWPVQLASIAPSINVEIERCVRLHTRSS